MVVPVLTPASKGREFLVRWRTLQGDPAAQAGLRPVAIGLAASFTTDGLLPYLGCFLAQRGLLARFLSAPFGQVYQALYDPIATLGGRPDVTVVLPRLEDLCGPQLQRLMRLDPASIEEARAGCHAEIERLCQALAHFEGRGPGLLVCGTLPAPPHTPLGVLDAGHPASQAQLRRELNGRLFRQAVAGRTRLFDLEGVVAAVGTARAYDERMGYLSRCPLSDELLRHAGLALSRSLAPLLLAPAKVVAVDLDNTLWGGIIGEDGLGGIALAAPDAGGVGAAFGAFQEALLGLRQQGVLICVASKNNEADALEVFARHPAMRLRREHLSAWRINWGAKSDSLRELAAELSLGLDSFVFIDDNPVECAEVRRLLPQVTVVELPRDPAGYVAALRAVPALDRMALTAEDLVRPAQYAAERARREALPAGVGSDPGALAEHLRALGLVLRVRRAREEDVARVAQLTQKTNQFNLTTIRRSEAEIGGLLQEDGVRVYAAEVGDRFGEYGLTGVVILKRGSSAAASTTTATSTSTSTSTSTWEIDTLLLSCRVLGRGVETGLLGVIVDELVGCGACALRGRFVPTAKNEPARGFLPGHGFLEEGEGSWVLAPLRGGEFAARVPHLRIEFSGEGV